jgi:hypothetical protein
VRKGRNQEKTYPGKQLESISTLLLLPDHQPVRSAYQPPASSTFLSEQTSHHQPASSTLLSEQTSTAISHQPTEQAAPPPSLLGFHQGIILHWFIQIDFSILSFLFFGGQFLNCK